MIQPRLMPHEIDAIELLCLEILVSPANGVPKAGFEGQVDAARLHGLYKNFHTNVGPGVILSLIQQIKGQI